jgi:Protein of unknown function (DUF2924)
MAESIPKQITKLHTLSRRQLLAMWQKLYQRAAPTGIRRELLVPFLAYRIQEQAYGGLKPSTRSELRRIARDLEKPTGSNRRRTPLRIKPGTRLIREWRGETHEVAITEAGFEYRGSNYSSLSEIACEITGTRWSGPAFFCLNKANSDPGRRHD